ncbi:uncharacterized protein LOC135705548 [Ochlerotatus camptorhynchus]|uniref:uncharacterized protein LOC135705548 n=1 Tax=Ochlerotatus camptorhynchus TaxID=644619 RepID=UPI0031D09393
MLVQELVDKLPPSYKLDWVRFERCSHGTPLRMFTDFMTGVVSDVSLDLNESSFPRNKNAKKKEFVHVHSALSKVDPSQGDKAAKPCWMCKRSDHKARYCDDFKKLSVTERMQVVEKHKLCEIARISGLKLPKQEVRFQEIMIGLDNIHMYASEEARIGRPGEPIGVRSKIGWTVYGPEKQNPSSIEQVNFHTTEGVTNQDLHDIFRIQYVLEELGVSPAGVPESNEDRARDIPTANDHYSPKGLTKRRLLALERRLAKNQPLRENVQQQIQENQLKQYAHLATEEGLAESDPATVWYLPLNVVENPRKPGKVHLVWDCRFRERRYAFGGDIKEMYHQFKIRKEDKNAQRFLFRDEPAAPEPQVYIMDVTTFGATCSLCSAQFIKNINASEFASQYPEAAIAAITDLHYGDDYYDSADTVAEAVNLAKEVKYVHSRGGFHIRNWSTISERVLGITRVTNGDAFMFTVAPKMAVGNRSGQNSKSVLRERFFG